MKFAVIGGDQRQNCLAKLLRGDGHWVKTAAMGERQGGSAIQRAAQAMEDAEYVILPLPATAVGGTLNAPQEPEPPAIRDIIALMDPSAQRLFAGRVDDALRKFASDRGLKLADYFEREELTVRNAAITAEGAVGVLMRELPVTIEGARILVIGFGRTGKLTAMKLKALGADVTAASRSYKDFAWTEAMGIKCADTRELAGCVWNYRAIVNTVPAPVLDEGLMEELDAGCLCVDLASNPGGTDMDAAARLGIRAVRELGLPGRVAPESAGEAIKTAVYHIIKEWECAE